MVTGVLVGLLALGERMPSSRAARAVILASWLAIALGVSGLANGPGECLLALGPMCLPATLPCQCTMDGCWCCALRVSRCFSLPCWMPAHCAGMQRFRRMAWHATASPQNAGGARTLVALAITRLPAWVWPRLPAQTALSLRSFARRHAAENRLPVVAILPDHPGSAPLPRRWSASPKADLLRAYSGYTAAAARSPTGSSKSRGSGLPAARGGAVADPAATAMG